jgi:hypothetical protein
MARAAALQGRPAVHGHLPLVGAYTLCSTDTSATPYMCASCVQMANGSFSLHALTDGGIVTPSAQNSWEQLQVVAMDTALAAIGTTDVLPDIVGPAKPEQGFSFCLLNNAWGTNYVMWTPYGPHGRGAAIKSRCAAACAGYAGRTVRLQAQALERPHGTTKFACTMGNSLLVSFSTPSAPLAAVQIAPDRSCIRVACRFIVTVRDARRPIPPRSVLAADAHLADIPHGAIEGL